ncbi:MAG: hypothetical protein LUD02_15520 [Tannerellaceae bacterium]|nr:hypothetical protein [Tannerellaceae bacterium]MCD8265383.1 hypothetical protein [Tannerellaceae bacterium]
MKQSIPILLISLLMFIACNNQVSETLEHVEKDTNIELYVYYEPENFLNTRLPDYNSKVYIYYDFSLNVPFFFEEGIITQIREGIIHHPDQTGLIDENGYVNIKPKFYDKVTLVIIESNYYSGILTSTSFINCERNNKAEFNFTKVVSKDYLAK